MAINQAFLHAVMATLRGIGPRFSARQAGILPLNYRALNLVDHRGVGPRPHGLRVQYTTVMLVIHIGGPLGYCPRSSWVKRPAHYFHARGPWLGLRFQCVLTNDDLIINVVNILALHLNSLAPKHAAHTGSRGFIGLHCALLSRCWWLVGRAGIAPATSRLSSARSSLLSYRPSNGTSHRCCPCYLSHVERAFCW